MRANDGKVECDECGNISNLTMELDEECECFDICLDCLVKATNILEKKILARQTERV